MAQDFYFISGLPRSGSSLLSAILRQNPRVHASITSPVGNLFNSILSQISAGSEYASMVNTEQRKNILHGLFQNYYQSLSDKALIFDTNRQWCAKLPALLDLFPNTKVVCCVRNVAWVMDSMERKFRENPYENTKLFNNDNERSTVYSRIDALANRNRLVGFSWSALKEAYYSDQSQALLLVDYELLSRSPAKVLPLIYQFIEQPVFEHDFNNVEFETPEFDDALGVKGLHTVKRKVEFNPRNTILPPDLFEKYSHMAFWEDSSYSQASVISPKKP